LEQHLYLAPPGNRADVASLFRGKELLELHEVDGDGCLTLKPLGTHWCTGTGDCYHGETVDGESVELILRESPLGNKMLMRER